MRNFIRTTFYRLVTLLLGDRDEFVTVRVLYGPARGIRLRLDMLRHKEGMYWFGKYERPILKTLAEHFLKPGMVVWDCGVYIGYYSCFFARAVGSDGQVVAFEPDASCLERAKQNALLNGLTNIDWKNAAIGDSTGTAQLILGGNTNSHLAGGWIGAREEDYRQRVELNIGEVEVPVYTLSDALDALNLRVPDLVKLDIEGVEGVAVPQAKRLIERCSPTFIVELHNPVCDREVWRFFNKMGYTIIDAISLEPIKSEEQSGGTLLCFPHGRRL